MKEKTLGIGMLALLLGLGLVAMTYADTDVSTGPFAMPANASANVNVSGCSNSGGPNINIGGLIKLGGLKADVILQNNVKGTHQTIETVNTVVLLDIGTAITIPKQPVLGGVGGNPHIWIQFVSKKGDALSQAFYLGRCVQGGGSVSADLLEAAVAAATVHSGDCNNSGGPTITLGGSLTLGGINARLYFTNNLKGTLTSDTFHVEAALVIEGTALTIPKQPSQGGVGGNPLVYIRFRQGNNAPIGDAILLGRCNKI
jgi:hypothetical protein